MKKLTHISLILALLVHLTGCGTLFWPERIGQKGGDVDIKVAVLDGIGLLFFIVPGVVAFFVDIRNGTIYLPNSRYGSNDTDKSVQTVKTDKPITTEYLQQVIKEKYAVDVDLNAESTRVEQVESVDHSRLFSLTQPLS